MNIQERNQIFEEHQGIIWHMIRKNYSLLYAIGIEQEDAYQELAIKALQAIEDFDAARGRTLSAYLYMMLQYGVLEMKKSHKPGGIRCTKDQRIKFVSLNSAPEGFSPYEIPSNDDYWDMEYQDMTRTLSVYEKKAVRMRLDGQQVRKRFQKRSLERAKEKILDYCLN